MPEFAVRNVEHDSVIDFCPISVVRQEDKLRVSVDEFLNEPRAGHAVHFNFLARDPFHKLDSCFVGAWFWYAVAAAILYGAHQIFTKLAAGRIGEGWGVFVVMVTAALSVSVFIAFFCCAMEFFVSWLDRVGV